MNRAFIELLQRIKKSPYRLDIKLINTIHDAVYLLVKDDPAVVKWLNDNLVECMEWQEDPKLQSDVKIGAELDIGYDWAHCITLPNRLDLITVKDMINTLKEAKQ